MYVSSLSHMLCHLRCPNQTQSSYPHGKLTIIHFENLFVQAVGVSQLKLAAALKLGNIQLKKSN